MERFYFDNAGTTRVFDEAVKEMNRIYTDDYYNPSALYSHDIKSELESKREYIASRLGLKSSEIFFTSGATEANNWALRSGIKNKNGNIVVSEGEHSSVYETAVELKSKGIEVRFAPLDRDGSLNLDKLQQLLDENTTLVSVICCSNETGAINDLTKIREIISERSKRAVFHSDCVQAFNKISFDSLAPDMMSFSAHKLGGPKGIGLLTVKKGLKIKPLIAGGGQESNMRSGTENTAGIIGFASAISTFGKAIRPDLIKKMRAKVKEALLNTDGVLVNEGAECSDFILSASIIGIKSEILQHLLYDDGYVIGLGSACSAKTGKNRVLKAMGLSDAEIAGSIRISFGAQNTLSQAEGLAESLKKNIKILKDKLR